MSGILDRWSVFEQFKQVEKVDTDFTDLKSAA